jgi:hypothetical protein
MHPSPSFYRFSFLIPTFRTVKSGYTAPQPVSSRRRGEKAEPVTNFSGIAGFLVKKRRGALTPPEIDVRIKRFNAWHIC